MKRLYFLLIGLLLIVPFNINAQFNDGCKITVGSKEYEDLLDDNYYSYEKFTKDDQIKITCNDNIKSIYIKYISKSVKGIVNEEKIKVGENGFVHEYLELSGKNKQITINYNDDFNITDLYAFTEEAPDWVEKWEVLDKADLMLFSTHGDDEQLFFLGLLPTYASRGKKVQVVYFTTHSAGPYANFKRQHEQLEGLWTVGIHYYPVFGEFPDEWAENYDEALAKLEKDGFTLEDATLYEVTQIRKYKPLVVVGHDEKGEYNHGQHILNTSVLEKAYLLANDESYDKNTVSLYGTHAISKLYLHLYKDNEIVMDYDTPLDYFGGKTAFEVSQDGFAKHYSQQNTWFHDWIYGEHGERKKATQIPSYSPCKFGLFYSSVRGDVPQKDVLKNDMFENIVYNEDNKNNNENNKTSDILKNIKEKVKDNVNDKKTKSINKTYLITGSILVVVSLSLIVILIKKR